MERKKCIKYLIFGWLILTGLPVLQAQSNPREQVYDAFISNRMDRWDQVIRDYDRKKSTLSESQSMQLVNFYYGYIGWAIGEDMKKEAKDYLKVAKELVEELMERFPEQPDLYAYMGALLGYEIGLNKIKAVVLGPESMKNIDKAIEMDPDRPQGWIERGNALFYMPKMFGGSKEEALEAYQKAIDLMERKPDALHKDWMYLNVLIILGQSYEKTDQLNEAKSVYEKALRIEPNMTWLRDELYPEFMKKYRADNE
jgi:tetratricopeptide (TPR) repeat protein